jgi:hypothetical protein
MLLCEFSNNCKYILLSMCIAVKYSEACFEHMRVQAALENNVSVPTAPKGKVKSLLSELMDDDVGVKRGRQMSVMHKQSSGRELAGNTLVNQAGNGSRNDRKSIMVNSQSAGNKAGGKQEKRHNNNEHKLKHTDLDVLYEEDRVFTEEENIALRKLYRVILRFIERKREQNLQRLVLEEEENLRFLEEEEIKQREREQQRRIEAEAKAKAKAAVKRVSSVSPRLYDPNKYGGSTAGVDALPSILSLSQVFLYSLCIDVIILNK